MGHVLDVEGVVKVGHVLDVEGVIKWVKCLM